MSREVNIKVISPEVPSELWSHTQVHPCRLNLWVEDVNEDAKCSQRFLVDRYLFSQRTRFQNIDIVETASHGRMLLLDGTVMVCQRDEYIYHEMICHVPLLSHSSPKRVLIVGGGDGGTLREVLKHSFVEQVVLVEIDETVIESCKKYLRIEDNAFEDSRVQIVIDDGARFLKETKENFDIILIDSSEPDSPSKSLYTKDFISDAHCRLSLGGIFILQTDSPFYEADNLKEHLYLLQQQFSWVHPFLFSNISYLGGVGSFVYASKNGHAFSKFNLEAYNKIKCGLKYYNKRIHLSSFLLPEYMNKNFSENVSKFNLSTWGEI